MDWFIKLESLLEFFYPSHCISCTQLIPPSSILCRSCFTLVKPVTSILLPLTQKKHLKVLSASSYELPLKKLVLRKFACDTLASKQLGQLLLKLVDIKSLNSDIIVPIPLHWTRYAQRGFNQAQVIADVIGKKLNKPVEKIIYRHKKTSLQSQLSKQGREENITGAFSINNWGGFKDFSYIQGKNILLIDDLCTTGLTLQQAAKTIMSLKPQSITALVACRAL